MKPPKAPPTKARLVVTPESSLEFGDILGSGAFGTVHEVCLSVYVLRMFSLLLILHPVSKSLAVVAILLITYSFPCLSMHEPFPASMPLTEAVSGPRNKANLIVVNIISSGVLEARG